MEETFIVVMLKEKESGFYVKEIGTYAISEHINYLVNINAEELENDNKDNKQENKIVVSMRVMYDKEILDWEYNAIYDYYDTSALKFNDSIIDCVEVEDCFEPTWEISFYFNENDEDVESLIHEILEKHHDEIIDVLETIKDKDDEYKEN